MQVLSRDSVTVSVDAVVYYRVKNPIMATNNVEDYSLLYHSVASLRQSRRKRTRSSGILSRDSVTVAVDAVVYYRVQNPTIAVSNVENFSHSTRLLAATTLRNVLGTKNLAEILSERETISHTMQSSLDEATDPWGVKVERVEIKDVRLPVQLQRAMAAEAEAAREARAKVIAAEGEQKASRALRDAAEVIAESPAALQLRYLQTLNTISAEKNSTIIFPLPIDILKHFIKPSKVDKYDL
ncbi:Band 7 protein [Daphnia magna]|uniref:Band 7 protein n=1 Tax=Daphnia magna TaxID=35525 RepID=A0A162PS69_9CRUS|nr:Band 7 protein [Daphnia magna]